MTENEFSRIDIKILQIADYFITYDSEFCIVRKNRKSGEINVKYDLDEMALVMSEWI